VSRIFLSHSSHDTRAAIAVKQWLAEQDPVLALEIFLDADVKTGIQSGTRWREELFKANSRCEAVVCLLSASWEASAECRTEFRTSENLGKRIICARLEDGTGTITGEWQYLDLFGTGPTAIDIGDGQPVEMSTKGLHRLFKAIRSAGIGAEHFAWPPANDPERAPYRGWQPLDEEDAAVFFGRDAALVRGMDAVRAMRRRVAGPKSLLIVPGPSGTGKSSFLRAGLLPRLRREDVDFTPLGIVRPFNDAITGPEGLAASVGAALKSAGMQSVTPGSIKAACLHDAQKVRDFLRIIQSTAAERLLSRGEASPAPSLVLPLDQAEELFSADASTEAEQLLELIADLVADVDLIVIATIRSDRFEVLQSHHALSGVETVVFPDLKPMPTSHFKEVILGPAVRASEAGNRLTIEADLVEQLLADAGEGADTLPLLSLALATLFDDYGVGTRLTLTQYREMGGIEHVLQTQIDKVLPNDSTARRDALEALRAAFIPWLATINPDNDQPLRRVARYSDLPEASRPWIDALVAQRLMIKGSHHGEIVIEVALESLLRQWGDLKGWLAEAARDLKTAEDLERQSKAWAAHEKNAAWLLSGARLADAESVVANRGFRERLSGTAEFLSASRLAENRRLAEEEARREAAVRSAQEQQRLAEEHNEALRRDSMILRAVLAVTVVVALVAVGGFAWAVDAQHTARSAQRTAEDSTRKTTAQRLVADARTNLASARRPDDEQAFQELIAAHELNDDHNPKAMFDALRRRASTLRIADAAYPVIGVTFSAKAHRLVVATTDDVESWDTASSGWRQHPLSDTPRSKPLNDFMSASVNPDGTAAAGAQGNTSSIKLTCVAISADGKLIALGDSNGAVRVWNQDTDNVLVSAARHLGVVTSVAFSSDGRLASAGADGTILVSDSAGADARAIRTPAEVFTVAFDPWTHHLASGGADGTLRIWNADTGAAVGAPVTAHSGGVFSVAFSPIGPAMISGGADGSVRLWNTDPVTPIGAPMIGHHGPVLSVNFNADASRVVSGGEDLTVRLWDVARRQPIGDPMVGHSGNVQGVAFISDGNEIVSGGNEHLIRVWNGDVGQPISTPLLGHAGPVTSVSISPDGRRIASGGSDATVRLWETDTGDQLALMTGHTAAVTSVAFSARGDILASGSTDGTVRLWLADTGSFITALPIGRPIMSIAISAQGDRLAAADIDGRVTIWELASRRQIASVMQDHAIVNAVAFSPKGDRLASGGADGFLRVWRAEGGTEVWTRDVAAEIPEPVKEQARMVAHRVGVVTSVAFSSDGSSVVSGSAHWASGSAVGVIQRWDADTGETPREGNIPSEPIVSGAAVMSVAVSPNTDQRTVRIASGSIDASIQLWQAGAPLGDLFEGHQMGVASLAFSADGSLLVSGSVDGSVRIWATPLAADPRDALCTKLTTNMSPQKWQALVPPGIPYPAGCPGLPPSKVQ
jgi:WD40 repeat protein